MSAKATVAVVGAGPVGLAAAAHLAKRGLSPLVFERGPSVGHAIRQWAHVRLFSPWRYNLDGAARALLEADGWRAPKPDALPTGAELVSQFLEPLAAHTAIAPHLRLRAEVTAIRRERDGAGARFAVEWRDAAGASHSHAVDAAIDASGTWFTPNPIGEDGRAVPGETAVAASIAYGIPDILGAQRGRYAGSRVLVIGGGHSAIHAVLDLVCLRQDAPATRIYWGLRRRRIDRLIDGGRNDALPARGALGLAAERAIAQRRVELLAPFRAERIERGDNAVQVSGRQDKAKRSLDVDRIVVATGFRPDLLPLGGLRLDLDPRLEAPARLAPLIDPELHSCGTVPPHGAEQLAHPEPGIYVAGAKSYGRAPTFLMLTGYEQVRSIAAALAGDWAAARDVQLVLPETGVCSAGTSRPATACRGATA